MKKPIIWKWKIAKDTKLGMLIAHAVHVTDGQALDWLAMDGLHIADAGWHYAIGDTCYCTFSGHDVMEALRAIDQSIAGQIAQVRVS